jgi:hypothetical protein
MDRQAPAQAPEAVEVVVAVVVVAVVVAVAEAQASMAYNHQPHRAVDHPRAEAEEAEALLVAL